MALRCLLLKIPSSCPFLPLSLLSSPTSPTAFLTCLRETGGAPGQTNKDAQHTHNGSGCSHCLYALKKSKGLGACSTKIEHQLPLSQTHIYSHLVLREIRNTLNLYLLQTIFSCPSLMFFGATTSVWLGL